MSREKPEDALVHAREAVWLGAKRLYCATDAVQNAIGTEENVADLEPLLEEVDWAVKEYTAAKNYYQVVLDVGE